MAQIFTVHIEADTDSDHDGNPDVSAEVTAFGFPVFKHKQNLDPANAFSFFGALLGQVRALFGK